MDCVVDIWSGEYVGKVLGKMKIHVIFDHVSHHCKIYYGVPVNIWFLCLWIRVLL